jgi:CheY-like chemotaxis protein
MAGSELALPVALILGLILAFRKFAPTLAERLNARFNPWACLATAPHDAPRVLAEEEGAAKFLAEFRIGPRAAPPRNPSTNDPIISGGSPESAEASERRVDPLQAFFAWAPAQVQALRKLLQDTARATEESERPGMLNRLVEELHQIKCRGGLPEARPAWQMASALEWLTKQLAEKPSRITSSTLRTLANGVDVLGLLCRPGLRADLCTNPPMRLLAVDDDAISRRAISFALKKGLAEPDLAEDGAAALALAAKQPYDVIFLDVQMPGMDGFEVCSKIHDTVSNRRTPVVFVTLCSDFDSRAKSAVCGGNDLIGKPFLIFEITVKALTLALRARIQAEKTRVEASDTATREQAPEASLSESVAATLEPTRAAELAPAGSSDECSPSSSLATWTGSSAQKVDSEHGPETSSPTLVPLPQAASQQDLAAPTPDNIKRFISQLPARLQPVRELIQRASRTAEVEVRQTLLADLFCRVSSLVGLSEQAEFGHATRVLGALEGLLRKLIEHHQNITPSTFQTMAAAIDLLGEVCAPEMRSSLTGNPAFHLLVVDDDPIARRAMASGLQVAFGHPAIAEDGETALTLANEQRFDVVFMDVQMPGIDGFTACARIHETDLNRHTPIVFVTLHADEETRRASAEHGGTDFITKPFLSSELRLKALTFALRGRLRNIAPFHAEGAVNETSAACLAGAR